MLTQDQLRTVIGSTAVDRDGDKLGKIGQLYYDDNTDQPKWITVNTGFFGTNENFVPIEGAEVDGDRVTLAYDKKSINDAPNIAEDGHLSVQDEEKLYQHYNLSYSGSDQTYATGDRDLRDGDDRDVNRDATDVGVGGHRTGTERSAGNDTSGPNTDDAMTRSEERLRVGTETQEAGRARLRKHVVTERQETTVPVSHEELRVEREPITDANRGDAYDGPSISEEEHEVTLHAERPVVSTETEAVERVRLGTETVTEQQEVGGEVRREEIEIDDSDVRRTDRS